MPMLPPTAGTARPLPLAAPPTAAFASRSTTRAGLAARRTAALLALVTLACACGDRSAPPAVPRTAQPSASLPPGSGAPLARPDEVVVNAELARRLVVGPVETRSVTDTIRVAGRMDLDQHRTARIGSPVTGRLGQIDAILGQQVRQGQVLAQIHSADLAQSQLNFLRANSQQQLTTRAVERAKLLLAADVIGSAELQRRESEQAVASAEKRAASDQLRQLGLTADGIRALEETGQIQPSAAIRATIAGTVIDRQVAQGQVVNPADALFVVSDLSTVWALAEVPEQDARFVRRGQKVRVEVPALGGERFDGKVAFVSDLVTPETRTVRLGVEMDNRDRRFRPSMLITMMIEGRAGSRQVVPAAAVVRENNADHVFVETRAGAFRLTPVTADPERDGIRALSRPLPDGTRLVLDGAFHLNNVRAQQAGGAQ